MPVPNTCICLSYFQYVKKTDIIIVPEDKQKLFYFLVSRSNVYKTFLGCISADDSYLKPMIIIKSKTIDTTFFRFPLFDNVIIEYQERFYFSY